MPEGRVAPAPAAGLATQIRPSRPPSDAPPKPHVRLEVVCLREDEGGLPILWGWGCMGYLRTVVGVGVSVGVRAAVV